MNIFYCSEINGNKATLTAEESAHCIRVMRQQKGDRVILIDGHGGMFDAVVKSPDSRRCGLEILKSIVHDKRRNYSLHIAIAPTKQIDRFEWFIEKSVEIGIDIITPLLCQRSERKSIRTDRLQKLILSTMKQAMVPYLPSLNELTTFSAFVNHVIGSTNNRFIAHIGDSKQKLLKDSLASQSNVIVLIGPEGDFTQSEIDLAIENDFIPVSLGKNRLRTETAGIVACNTVNLINELK
jgi:16S rRNA (uracil1498-N3)-methyltransferase